MKNLIKGIIFTISLIFITADASAREYPKYRVVSVDASNYKDQYSQALNQDPYESINRKVFAFNNTLDDFFVEPVARGYRYIMPEWGRDRVSSFFNNLGEIPNFINSILQGDIESTFRSFTRFGINSTLGIGGLHDLAAGFGLHEKDKTFSQTLALYGLNSGNYIVLPILGPSTSRDFFSNIAQRATEPQSYLDSGYLATSFGLVELVSTREGLLDLTDEIEITSFDPYSAFKSAYLQNRRGNLLKTIE